MSASEKINIRPEVNILSVLKYLEYETWFALAEFVDNSIASYQQYSEELKSIHGSDFQLEVSIEIDQQANKITIRDNAAGIHAHDFKRAFRAAEVPPDTSGLSEFGMGMKSAACWFANAWTVRTTALNESVEKTIRFDMQKIFEDKLEELDVTSKSASDLTHFTIIELLDVNKIPRRRGLGKVKDHLKSIYREFIRSGDLILKVDGETLEYKDPKILKVTRYDDPKGAPILWKREINFPIESGLSVHGFVAIREKASTSQAGFALFRRGRVIEGSFDNGFRPEFIFGNPNSFRYQRVFGELHLEGFDVSFTKKGIQWDENLDIFLRLLKEDLSTKSFPLLQQAENYRVRSTEKEYKSTKKALDKTVDDLEKNAPNAVNNALGKKPNPGEDKQSLIHTEKAIQRVFELRFNRVSWKISIELSFDPSIIDLMEIGDHLIGDVDEDSNSRQIGIRLSLIHPFMVQFVGVDNSKVEPVLRMVAALGLSEVIAKESGAKTQGEVRRNFNELMNSLSKIDGHE